MAVSTTSSIHIDADPAAVLDVIADLQAYPEWTGGMKNVEILSEDDQGWPDEARFTIDQGPIKDTYVLQYTWDVDEASEGTVSWVLVQGDMLKALDGSYVLEPADGGTEVTYNLSADFKVPMLGAMKRKAEKTIVDTALKELKKRVEG